MHCIVHSAVKGVNTVQTWIVGRGDREQLNYTEEYVIANTMCANLLCLDRVYKLDRIWLKQWRSVGGCGAILNGHTVWISCILWSIQLTSECLHCMRDPLTLPRPWWRIYRYPSETPQLTHFEMVNDSKIHHDCVVSWLSGMIYLQYTDYVHEVL